MKRKKYEVYCVCNKCGKQMPTDKEKSNENWTAYINDCACGGRAIFSPEPPKGEHK